MTRTCTLRLASAAHEMAQEEIQKQVAFLSKDVGNVRFREQGAVLEFTAPESAAAAITTQVESLVQRTQRSLRNLQRKLVYRSPAADRPVFRGAGDSSGVHQLGPGQVALSGVALRLFRYFDRVFEDYGRVWRAEPLLTPTLIPTRVLAQCDYFRSFPHNVTFACHLFEDAGRIEGFRARHQDREELDDRALADMQTPEACLSPAVCYHVYHLNRDRVIPAEGLSYAICGKCFRYESSNMSGLRRLWDFTMREVVFLGDREEVLRGRQRGIELFSRWMEEHQLAGEIRTASDPFFVAPDALAKTYFQLSSETKFEISLLLPDDGRLAVGSFNYHSDFFGKAFHCTLAQGGPMHSVCIAFGLERWVYAFLAQHGEEAAHWPEVVRCAPEFCAA